MPTTQTDYDQIEAARNKVSSLATTAGNQQAGASTFRDEVMSNVRNARAERGMSTLSTDLGNVTSQLALGRSQIRERAGDVVNPLQVDQLGERQRAQALGGLASISNTMAERQGTLEESIQSGANTLQASALRTKAQADAASIELQNLMQVVQQKQTEAQALLDEQYRRDTLAENTRQFNVQEGRLRAASQNTGYDSPIISALMERILGAQGAGGQEGSMQPPMSAREGTVTEYPKGSGVYWTAGKNGIWE